MIISTKQKKTKDNFIGHWSYLTVRSRRPPFQDSRMKSPLEFLKMTTSWLKSSEKARIEDESSIAFTMASEKIQACGSFNFFS